MEKNNLSITPRRRLAFAFGEIGDNVAYQTFSFLLFTFYFSVVHVPVTLISFAFIIWSIWNALNDPLIGFLSDRTRNKRGRRIVWMLGATIPLAILMVLLFTAPLGADVALQFIYLLIILFAFDTAYTSFNLNYNSLFSEMFITAKDRSEAGKIRGVFVVIALILAFVLPTFIITDITNQHGLPETPLQFLIVGIIAACIIIATYTIVLKYGAIERPELKFSGEKNPPFKEAMKFTFTNKTFMLYLIVAISIWTCNGILPTVVPFFATYVLQVTEEDSLSIGLILAAGFVVAAFSMPVWTKIRQRKGTRFMGLVALALWAIALLIFMFMTDFISALLAMLFVGFGLGGSIYVYDQCMAEIIDEDEIMHGTRRSGAYYGVVNFIIRLSGVLNFLVIGIVFTGSAWENYTINPGVNTILGIQFLIGIYPAIILIIGIIGLFLYPIKGARLAETQKKVETLHKTGQDERPV
nr:MFS transporter [Candidatus Sigynarchaeota archaeon]